MPYTNIEKDELGIAVVWLDQPGEKVNKLSLDIIDEFKNALSELEQDSDIKAVILISRKEKVFIAGADVEQFLDVTDCEQGEQISREGNALLNSIENFPKPVVAAIHGAAMGGGLEVALACNYRIASDHPQTIFALPEVKLGVLPAAGGTQRLPRLIGLQRALELMLTGKNVYVYKAKKIGLVDDVTYRFNLLNAAKQIALRLTEQPCKRKNPKPFLQKLVEATPIGRNLIYKGALKTIMRQTLGNYPAPLKILDCAKIGMQKGIKAGFAAEAQNLGLLLAGNVSKELIRIFLNMKAREKNPWPEQALPVNKIGILGGGFMGTGVAEVTAGKGIPVVIRDISDQSLEIAEKNIYRGLTTKVKKKALAAFERDRISSRIFTSTDYHGFANTDLVVEAVYEDLEIKRKVLAEIEEIVREDCVFASNTSCIPIADIAAQAKHPERVLGMHYFSPVAKMPLLEIIVTEKTADWALATAVALGVLQKKTIIVVNDSPGFYTTRILAPFLNEASSILDEGGDIASLDKALRKFGFPVGPVALFDEVGIDVAAHVSRILGKLFAHRQVHPSDTVTKLAEAGYYGRKNGKGFYQYPAKGKKRKKKQVNNAIYQFFGGTQRKIFADREMQNRLVCAMLNEAAYCLQEKILRSAEDGDIGAIFGIGFPPFLGGPFRYMDALGIAKVVAMMEELEKQHGNKFTPARILKDMAATGTSFYPQSK